MKRLITLTASALMAVTPLLARQLTADEALARVQSAESKSPARQLAPSAQPRLIHTERVGADLVPYYVFADSRQTMFVSGDDRADALLGYIETPLENLDNIPSSMRWWLNQYSRQIEYMNTHAAKNRNGLTLKNSAGKNGRTVQRKAAVVAGEHPSISPMLKTAWDQGAPYNDQCPQLDGETTYTGCVATAMAQAMYYHKWPAKGTGTKSWTWENGQQTLSGSLDVTFDWNNMLLTYETPTSGTAAQRNAVATLMKACGYSVEMEYGCDAQGGSGAQSMPIALALIENFGYDVGTSYEYRDFYTDDEWDEIIYKSLSTTGPVIYCGEGDEGGHCFILDGYKPGGYYHFDWGWSGAGNGYFKLDALDPNYLGAGGGSGGFNYLQDAITGMQKPTTGTKRQDPWVGFMGIFTGESSKRKVTLSGGFEDAGFVNSSPVAGTFDFAIQFTNTGTKASQTVADASKKNIALKPNEFIENIVASLPSSMGAGNYKITPMYRQSGASTWKPIRFDLDMVSELNAKFDGTNFTIDDVTDGSELPDAVWLYYDDPDARFVTGQTTKFRVRVLNEEDVDRTFKTYACLVQWDAENEVGYYMLNARGKETTIVSHAAQTEYAYLDITIPVGTEPGQYMLGYPVIDDHWDGDFSDDGIDVMITVEEGPDNGKGDASQVSATTSVSTVYIGEANQISTTFNNPDASNTCFATVFACLMPSENDLSILEAAEGPLTAVELAPGKTTVNLPLPIVETFAEGEYYLAFVRVGEDGYYLIDGTTVNAKVRGEAPAKGTITTESLKYYFTIQTKPTVERDVKVTGTGITGNITAKVSGTGSELFKLSTTSLPAAGGNIVVTFDPVTEVGTYRPKLILSADNADPVEVELIANSTALPDLEPVTPPAETITLPDRFTTDWEYSATKNNYTAASDYLSLATPITRAMALKDNTLYLVVQGDAAIKRVDALTGKYLGTLSTAGITQQSYTFAGIANLDGTIVACNMPTTAAGTLRVYAWTSDDADPFLLLETTDHGARCGDAMSATGTLEDGKLYFSSNAAADANKLYAYEVLDSDACPDADIIELTKDGKAYNIVNNFATAEVKELSDGNLLVSGKGLRSAIFTPDGAFVSELPAAIHNPSNNVAGSSAEIINHGDYKLAAVVTYEFAAGVQGGRLVLSDMTDEADPVILNTYPNLAPADGTKNDSFATKVLARTEGNTIHLWTLIPKQGIAKYTATANKVGVTDLEAADAYAAVEYYNLQGIRIDAENMTPGLYIRRQGRTTAKVLVR